MTCAVPTGKTKRRIFRGSAATLSLLATASVLALSGCGGGQPADVGRVTGVVTLDGEPLAGAQVQFIPESGRPSSAETGSDGRYRLRYTMEADGALIGRHTVEIRTAVDDGDVVSEERLPSRYHSPSELTAEVQAGTNTINFDLFSE